MLIRLVKTVLPLMCLDVQAIRQNRCLTGTDLAVYDHIEVVRGATGLTQSNSEPGGTINLIRKRPTALFKHTGEISTDHRGSKRLVLDVSGSLNNEHTVRGRLVGVHEDHRSLKRVYGTRKTWFMV